MKYIKHNNYHKAWPIIQRHLMTSWRFLTIRKLVNIFISKIEEKTGRTRLLSKPYFIKIEPTNRCNLSCKGCLHAADNRELEKSGKLGDFDIELFKRTIDEIKPYLVKVSLYVAGEPLIYRDISRMIRHLTENNIGSVISSNLNFMTAELARDLVKNKLTHLIVSLDGSCESSYQTYRQGGSLEKVIANLKLIQAEKKKQNSSFPIVEIQTVKLAHIDENEINNIRKIAQELGADIFSVKEDLTGHYTKPKPQKKRCFWLYGHPSIKWNGIVQPCCFFYEDEHSFGDLKKNSLSEIFNNEHYRAAREYFRSGVRGQMQLKCYKCNFFTK